jgi:serine/threonine-protein kinase
MARERQPPPPPPPPDDEPTWELPPDDPRAAPTERYPRAEVREEEVYEEVPPPEAPRSWWRENLWVWLLALLVLVVGGLLLLWFLQRDGEDRVVVPAVVGLSQSEASATLVEAGLEPVVQLAASDEPAGRVVAQAPGGGTQVAEGEPVVLTVSGGSGGTETQTTTVTTTTTTTTTPTRPPPPATVSVQDVVGLDQVEAGAVLEGDGLVADSYPVASDQPAGTVVAQSPAAGEELEPGETIRLNVSLGPDAPEPLEVPDVTGPEASDAREIAREAGFTVRTLYRDAPSEDEIGEVLDQRPAAGTTAPALSQITLFVGR